MTPGKYLGYSTSTIFILGFCWTLYEAFVFMPPWFHPFFGIALGSVMFLSIVAFAGLKLWAMWNIDVADGKRRVTSRKSPVTSRRVISRDK